MGSGTYRQRAVGEARTACLAAHRAEVSTETANGSPTWRPALVDVPEEPCAGDQRDEHLPAPVRIGGDRASPSTADSLQCDGAPDSGLDAPTVAPALGFDTHYGYLLHDRDSIFSRELDAAVGGLGLRILKTPPRCPMANGLCERVIGTIRRECLDWLIPLSEAHLRHALRSWVEHYNRGRPHMMLGPGVPDPPAARPTATPKSCHHLRDFGSVRSKPVLGGLHHEYSLCPA